MTIRKFVCLFIAFPLVGCASTPRYSNTKATDEKQFENGLKYSKKIFHEPINILVGEFSDSTLLIEYASDIDGNRRKSKTALLENGFGVQIASFTSEQNANNYLSELKNKRLNEPLNMRFYDGFWRVFAGFYKSRDEAEKSKVKIRSYGYSSAWIITF